MQRSLYSGVTGLTNHQLILDTTANNLANISTNGFKGSRISFSTALMQTQNSGSSPTSTTGGLNPRQVGLGVQNSSVDVDMRQGALVTTGRTLDLAVQGAGFFRVVGADGSAAYTRVGNFGFDSKNNMTDLGTGMFVQGRRVDAAGQPAGDRSNINLANNQSIDAKATDSVTFQGNLSATAKALAGTSLSSVLPLTIAATGDAAVEATMLKDLSTFTGPSVEPLAPANSKTLHAFGTKPDGTAWAASVTINPWQENVQNLMTKLNSVMVQGSETFGTMKIENGSLVATGSGDQGGFSMFVGENDPLSPSTAGGTATTFAGNSGAYLVPSSTVALGPATVPLTGAGLLDPVFTVQAGGIPTASMNIKVKITSGTTTKEVGNIVIPSTALVGDTFSLASLPHVKAGDQITFELASSGTMGAPGLAYTTNTYLDSSGTNLLRDTFTGATGAGAADGTPDLFQENSTVDVNAYVYDATTNSTMDWYRMRMVPEKVTSSLQVYDSVGGSHTVQAQFFRTGTRSVVSGNTTVRYNSWDMVLSIPPKDGQLTDPVVVGIEFDEKGRYVGNGRLGSTVHGNTLSDPNQFKGTPSDNTIGVKWAATGDATIKLNFGDSSSTNGLTGFGSASTAAAVDQNGYASGSLSSLSVTNGGQLVGLYSNGKSLNLYEIEIDTFRNPAGLSSLGQNLWQVSANSGDPLARSAGQGGAGTITSGALEGSNVDIASEFTRLITAQRGFQVNSRVIQTTDSILQELAGLIRG